MSTTVKNIRKTPEYSYHLLRGSLEKFQKNISELNYNQYQQAKIIADKTCTLESSVLSTVEARNIQIPESKLNLAIQEVRARYASRDLFLTDLKNNELDEDILRKALYRELLFDAVMNRITATISPVCDDVDIQIYYEFHKEHFVRPEKRRVSHILITINPQFTENDRDSSYARINVVAEKLQSNPARFEILAKKYSECPTAMHGGELGEVPAGSLYPQLDKKLFAMQEDTVSDVIETELGFHILRCEKINNSVTMPLSRVKTHINHILYERQKKACQKAWLSKLKQA